jgi:hypothetical protein
MAFRLEMSKNLITELTPEQEALIPVYREKWRAIALSTDPIDRQKATEAVKLAYAAMPLARKSLKSFFLIAELQATEARFLAGIQPVKNRY